MAKTKTTPWDPAEHLETDEDIAAYLEAALEEGDPTLVAGPWRHRPRQRHDPTRSRDRAWAREPLQGFVALGQP